MFVEHEGKSIVIALSDDVSKTRLPAAGLQSLFSSLFFYCSTSFGKGNYASFFDEMSKEISKNVKLPSYVDVVSADFSSTTPVQRIVSQITLMSSLQEFFEYK